VRGEPGERKEEALRARREGGSLLCLDTLPHARVGSAGEVAASGGGVVVGLAVELVGAGGLVIV